MADERPGEEKRERERPIPEHLRWTFLEEEAEKAGLIIRNPAAAAAAPFAPPHRVTNQK